MLRFNYPYRTWWVHFMHSRSGVSFSLLSLRLLETRFTQTSAVFNYKYNVVCMHRQSAHFAHTQRLRKHINTHMLTCFYASTTRARLNAHAPQRVSEACRRTRRMQTLAHTNTHTNTHNITVQRARRSHRRRRRYRRRHRRVPCQIDDVVAAFIFGHLFTHYP